MGTWVPSNTLPGHSSPNHPPKGPPQHPPSRLPPPQATLFWVPSQHPSILPLPPSTLGCPHLLLWGVEGGEGPPQIPAAPQPAAPVAFLLGEEVTATPETQPAPGAAAAPGPRTCTKIPTFHPKTGRHATEGGRRHPPPTNDPPRPPVSPCPLPPMFPTCAIHPLSQKWPFFTQIPAQLTHGVLHPGGG